MTEFSQNIDPRGGLGAITAGRDGNLWFTESNVAGTALRIGRITPSGKITEFSRGISGSPDYITAGPDGNLWFTEGYGVIGPITPNGTVTEFSRGVPGLPGEITAAADGNLWFTDTGSNDVGPVSAVGRITPQGRVRIFTRGITQGFSDSQGSARSPEARHKRCNAGALRPSSCRRHGEPITLLQRGLGTLDAVGERLGVPTDLRGKAVARER